MSDFSPYVSRGEVIRWSGRPAQGLQLRPSDAAVIPFTLLWCGFAIFWETTVVTAGAPWFFKLWGVPFVAIGLYMVIGRFFADAYARSRTYYAVTDRQALILSGMFETKLTAIDLATLSELHFKPSSSGRGTIVFGPDTGAANPLGWGGRNRTVASPEFFKIDGASAAYAAIQRQRDGARSG